MKKENWKTRKEKRRPRLEALLNPSIHSHLLSLSLNPLLLLSLSIAVPLRRCRFISICACFLCTAQVEGLGGVGRTRGRAVNSPSSVTVLSGLSEAFGKGKTPGSRLRCIFLFLSQFCLRITV